MSRTIKAFIINLPHRTDRKKHILREFEGRTEFDATVIAAREHTYGATGLWETISHIISDHAMEEDYFVLCEDDHQFTEHYSPELLFRSIAMAIDLDADLLNGGPSWFSCSVPAGDHLYWTERFSGLQFTIIFRKAYGKILEAPFVNKDVADHKISAVTSGKYFIHPFISIQQSFGYSDVTPQNNTAGWVAGLFERSAANVTICNNIRRFYETSAAPPLPVPEDVSGVSITTYVLHPGGPHLEVFTGGQFADKPEFIPFSWHTQPGATGTNQLNAGVLKNIITHAIMEDEDIIIICSEKHRFPKNYSGIYLIRQILEAHRYGAEMLFGGASDIGLTVAISDSLFWVSTIVSPHFVILFKSGFSQILEAPEDNITETKDFLSGCLSNKMLLCPFVSESNSDTENRLRHIYDRQSQQRLMVQPL